MKELMKLLFPNGINYMSFSLVMLLMRLSFGTLFMIHGLNKILNYEVIASGFPDPLGLGIRTSLMLVIFAEMFCSLAVIFGVLFRLALIPMMFTMIVAAFMVHGGAGLEEQEHPILFLLIFIMMFLLGPGEFSFDNLIRKWLVKKKNKPEEFKAE